MTISDLIAYLDRDLSSDDLRTLSRDDLAQLNRLLYHWERITDRELIAARQASKEEEPE
jgi:hypothetical protein